LEQWMKEINPEVLPEPYRKLTSIIGLENTMKLAKEFQGTTLYFTKLDSTIKLIRDKKIREEFDGGNHKQLAIKYGLTEAWVRKILAERPDESHQPSLFSEEFLESTFGK